MPKNGRNCKQSPRVAVRDYCPTLLPKLIRYLAPSGQIKIKWGPAYKIISHEKVLNFLKDRQCISENRRLSKKTKNKIFHLSRGRPTLGMYPLILPF